MEILLGLKNHDKKGQEEEQERRTPITPPGPVSCFGLPGKPNRTKPNQTKCTPFHEVLQFSLCINIVIAL